MTITAVARSLASVVGQNPGSIHLLAFGARIPPRLKSYPLYRILASIASRASLPKYLPTNLGMQASYRCEVSSADYVALFGKPEFYTGERGALALAALLARNTASFVDIGAHQGYFSFYVRSKLPYSAPIYFFEPDPQLYTRIVNNIRASNLQNIYGQRGAIGAVDGHSTFYQNLDDNSSGSLGTYFIQKHRTREITVEVARFDTFAKAVGLRNACVKVDVENAEFDFIEGCGTSLASISALIMEVLGPAHERGFVQMMIKEHGLQAYYINDYRLEHAPDGTFTYVPPQYNWLFCRLLPRQLAHTLRGTAFKVA